MRTQDPVYDYDRYCEDQNRRQLLKYWEESIEEADDQNYDEYTQEVMSKIGKNLFSFSVSYEKLKL